MEAYVAEGEGQDFMVVTILEVRLFGDGELWAEGSGDGSPRLFRDGKALGSVCKDRYLPIPRPRQ